MVADSDNFIYFYTDTQPNCMEIHQQLDTSTNKLSDPYHQQSRAFLENALLNNEHTRNFDYALNLALVEDSLPS